MRHGAGGVLRLLAVRGGYGVCSREGCRGGACVRVWSMAKGLGIVTLLGGFSLEFSRDTRTSRGVFLREEELF